MTVVSGGALIFSSLVVVCAVRAVLIELERGGHELEPAAAHAGLHRRPLT